MEIIVMKCPICNGECEKGILEAHNGGLFFGTSGKLSWYPEAEENKKLKDHEIPLTAYATAYYCHDCEKIFVTFDATNAVV